MTDRSGALPNLSPAEGGPPTKATSAARLLEDAEAEALAVTKTQATGKGRIATDEGPIIQRLPVNFGRYRLIRELGRGGMGAVVLAEDTQLSRLVALKIPFLKKASDTKTLKRFQREAKAAAALAHPNLCAVYDFGTFNKQHFLSMAYIEGKPLQAFLDSGSAIPQRTAAIIIKKIAQALQHAHERGVIHRDLKPSNIMIEPKLGPIVTDFGLARCLDDDGEVQLTQDGVAIGTPSYMSPEQLEGESSQIGPQSDIFSLGLILYEMLTGQRRFTGKVTSIIGQILTKDPVSLRGIREDVDPQLDVICRKMMARNPAERYATMAEVADTMRAYLKGNLIASSEPANAAEPSTDSEPFFLGLAAGMTATHAAPSTQNGAALAQTEEGPLPLLLIADEDSHASRILHRRSNSTRSKITMLTVMLGLFTAAACFVISQRLHHLSENAGRLAESPIAANQTASPAVQQAAPPETHSGKTLAPAQPASPPDEDVVQETGTPVAIRPAIAESKWTSHTDVPQAAPMNSGESPSTGNQLVKLISAKGKLDFRATLTKTINGSTTEKKYTTARSILPELTQLDRREKGKDAALEQVRVVILLNGNAFEYSQSSTPRELATALEEAIPQNIQAEEIFAKLEYLNPRLADPPPSSLSREESDRIKAEVQKIHSATNRALQSQLMFGRSLAPQEEVDKYQFLFEQECQKIKGIPERYPLPKLRARLFTFGASTRGGSPYYEGDSEHIKEQTPRGKIIKRIAAALNLGNLIAPTLN